MSITTQTTGDLNPAFLPEEIGELITRPVTENSIATTVADVHNIGSRVNLFRVPIVAADPTADWVGEGEEIDDSQTTFDEVYSPFYKLAGLSVVSRELVEDSSPEAANIIGLGLARDIAAKLDAAFFGSNHDGGNPGAPLPNVPKGLEDLASVNDVEAGATWENLDPFTEAIYAAQGTGATLQHFVANPADALALAQLKEATGSNRDLLQPDPTQPTRRTLGGVPLLVSPSVTEGTIWGIPSDRALIAIREDVTLAIDRSVYFTSDRVAIRATLRATMLFPHEQAIQKVALDD